MIWEVGGEHERSVAIMPGLEPCSATHWLSDIG